MASREVPSSLEKSLVYVHTHHRCHSRQNRHAPREGPRAAAHVEHAQPPPSVGSPPAAHGLQCLCDQLVEESGLLDVLRA